MTKDKRYDDIISLIELSMQTLKRLLLTARICCFMVTANAMPTDDALAAYNKGNYTQALKIIRPLATQGDAQAQNNLGLMYENGQGVTLDYKTAD